MDKSDNDNKRSADRGAAAIGLALDAARDNPALTEDAGALLREQARLARLQADELKEEGAYSRWSLRVKHGSEVMKFAFELSIGFVLVAIVAALATAMWSAAHDNGLVIEAFSVPPDLASRGLSGEVVASQFLDKLTRMQEETNSIRPADTYRNNWGDEIKVEIPDTGISIGELNRYLRHWLGRETHITGEIFHTPSGLAVTARASEAGQTFVGKDGDLDALMQKAAESIYAETQPYRYAAFLNEQGRNDEAMSTLAKLGATASPAERAWALSLLGNLYLFYDRPADALATQREAVAADPTNAHAWDNLSSAEQTLNHVADAYRHTRKALQLYDSGSVSFDPDRVALVKLQDEAFLATVVGDYRAAEAADEAQIALPGRGDFHTLAQGDEMLQAAFDHDFALARKLRAALHPASANEQVNAWFNDMGVAYLEKDWPRLAHLSAPTTIAAVVPASYRAALREIMPRLPGAVLAAARAEQGDVRTAQAMIAATPLDCYECLRARGKIDASAKNWAGAAYWFQRAIEAGNFIPTAWTDWGAMLLEKGDIPGAIEKLEVAAAKGPHYADPQELLGEALMRENRSDLALAKFEEANRYAPDWGRLHLKWGEALRYTVRTREAEAQWSLASKLDLTAAERKELASVRNRRP